MTESKKSGAALKYDQDKPRWDLISVPALAEMCKVLAYGAKKYSTESSSGEHNWRKGFNWSRLYAGILRHTTSSMNGEDLDPETGLDHMAHAMCGVMFVLEHKLRGLGTDDRYKQDKQPTAEAPLEAPQNLRMLDMESELQKVLSQARSFEQNSKYWEHQWKLIRNDLDTNYWKKRYDELYELVETHTLECRGVQSVDEEE